MKPNKDVARHNIQAAAPNVPQTHIEMQKDQMQAVAFAKDQKKHFKFWLDRLEAVEKAFPSTYEQRNQPFQLRVDGPNEYDDMHDTSDRNVEESHHTYVPKTDTVHK